MKITRKFRLLALLGFAGAICSCAAPVSNARGVGILDMVKSNIYNPQKEGVESFTITLKDLGEVVALPDFVSIALQWRAERGTTTVVKLLPTNRARVLEWFASVEEAFREMLEEAAGSQIPRCDSCAADQLDVFIPPLAALIEGVTRDTTHIMLDTAWDDFGSSCDVCRMVFDEQILPIFAKAPDSGVLFRWENLGDTDLDEFFSLIALNRLVPALLDGRGAVYENINADGMIQLRCSRQPPLDGSGELAGVYQNLFAGEFTALVDADGILHQLLFSVDGPKAVMSQILDLSWEEAGETGTLILSELAYTLTLTMPSGIAAKVIDGFKMTFRFAETDGYHLVTGISSSGLQILGGMIPGLNEHMGEAPSSTPSSSSFEISSVNGNARETAN